MTTTTTHRPAPLPPRPGQPTAVPGAARRPQLAGVAGWQKWYLDSNGQRRDSEYDVPVNAEGNRTDHIRYACRGHIEVGGVKQDCDQVAWLLPDEKPRYCPDHGCSLTPDGQALRDPLLPWGQIRRAVEPSASPWWVLLAELAAGIGEYAGHVPWWAPLAATPVLAAGTYEGTRRYLTRRALRNKKLEPGQVDGRRVETIRRRARAGLYMGTGAGAWLTAAAAVDPTTRVGAAMLGGSLLALFAASAPTWWRYVEADKNRAEPEPAAQPDVLNDAAMPGTDEIDATEAARVWTAEVAYPGTKLDPTTWKRIKGGWQAVIVATKRGALNGLGGDNMPATVKRVAGGFDVTRAAIGWIDEYEGSPNKALLLVQPDSPLKEDITWQPPGVVPIDEAFLHLGMRIDGSPLRSRLWQPGWGAPSRWLVGTKGSGKTEALRLLLLGMLEVQVMGPAGPTRLVAPFLHDPKRGKDFGAFRRQVSGFSTTPDCLHMIVEAIIREMDRRYDALGSDVWFDDLGRPREGETAFDPTIHGPIISLVVDEFHEPAKDQALMAKLDPMGRKMRAGGIEIVAASHMSTISDAGSQVFRDMLAGGEAWLFRTTSGLNASLATGGQLVGDPRGLPREPGSVLHASGDDDTMQSRMAYVPSDPLYNRLYDERNQSRVLPVVWPPETLEAFGPDFVEWMRECQARQPGDPPPATPKPFGGAVSSIRPSVADASADVALRQILFAASGPMERKQIAGHAMWAPRSVTSTLTKALKDGQDAKWLRKLDTGNGLYELESAARERMQAERDEAAE